MRWIYILVPILAVTVLACVPEPTFPPQEGCLKTDYHGIFILNEGPFEQNAATLDVVTDGENPDRCESVFSLVNGIKLGDTGNSLYLQEDTLFVVVNVSKIIYKIQLPDLTLLDQLSIPGKNASPRQMAIISPHKAYLVSLEDSSLYVFDPVSMTLDESPILVENFMEGIALAQDKAFITCGSYVFPNVNNKVAVIDTKTDTVIQYISLPIENPGPIMNHNGLIYVVCRGNIDPNGPGSALVAINPLSEAVVKEWFFEGYTDGLEGVGDYLLMIGESGVIRVDPIISEVNEKYLLKSQITENTSDLIYGTYFDEENGELYVVNAKGGAINGEVLVFDPFLNIVRRFETGVFTGDMVFYR